jgi:hypothetical protein
MKNVGGSYVTEAISDFTAFTKATGGEFTDAENPSWFGTVKCDGKNNVVDGSGVSVRVAEEITCSNYVVMPSPVDPNNPQQTINCNASTDARDFYGIENGEIRNQGCYSIKTFVDKLQPATGGQSPANGATGLNYLSLTNIMNPAMFDEKKYSTIVSREKASRIYFRVETYEDKTVREVAEIASDGYSGDSKQSIRVMKKRDSYMPVFNFSIYSTYGSEDEYYYDNKPKE